MTSDTVLLLALVSLFCGLLGGAGGRFAALWSLRKDLHALASVVDPEVKSKLAQALEELRAQASTVAALASTINGLKGSLGAMVKKDKLSETDVDFLVGMVLDRIARSQRVPLQPVAR